MVHRLFSVDVVMVLLEQPERQLQECEDPDLACFLPHKFLIQNLLFARRLDSSPTVQGHALACLAQCLELSSFNATRAVHDLFCASEISLSHVKNYLGQWLMSAPGFLTYFLSLFRWNPDCIGCWSYRRYNFWLFFLEIVSLRWQRVVIHIPYYWWISDKSDQTKVFYLFYLFLGISSSQQTQKTFRTLPFRTVEITSTDVSGSDGKAGELRQSITLIFILVWWWLLLPILYTAKENLALLLRRVEDSKTNVRKSALQVLKTFLI